MAEVSWLTLVIELLLLQALIIGHELCDCSNRQNHDKNEAEPESAQGREMEVDDPVHATLQEAREGQDQDGADGHQNRRDVPRYHVLCSHLIIIN